MLIQHGVHKVVMPSRDHQHRCLPEHAQAHVPKQYRAAATHLEARLGADEVSKIGAQVNVLRHGNAVAVDGEHHLRSPHGASGDVLTPQTVRMCSAHVLPYFECCLTGSNVKGPTD